MEPIGLAVGIAGLAGLFSSCLEVVEKVNSYRSFGSDSHVLDAQFKSEKLRLEQWGRAVGLDQGNKAAKLLWIHGPAGFGKTILCARVIEHLSTTLATPVAYFFFSSDFESRGDPFTAIRSWISQVMSSDAGAFDLVRQRWEDQQEQVATRATVVKLFRDLLLAIPGCTFVLDGLDECTSMDEHRMGAGSESIARFLETVKQAAADTTTRIMIVSRDESEIRDALMDDASEEVVEYKISHEDVRADTVSYSKDIVCRKLSNKSEDIKSDISQQMAGRCEGQFLWLKLQEDHLRRGLNKKQLQDAIAKTPRGLERLYERYWERMAGFEERERSRAFSLLRWAAFALRPLTICEITEAVLIDERCHDFPTDELPDSIDEDYIDTEILGLCGTLLEVRSSSSEASIGLRTVHLTHFSVKQYILRNIPVRETLLLANESLRASNEAIESSRLAQLCLRYINFRHVW
ncbi:ankyrin-1, partial [Dactylonectria macrodidyma]